VCEFSNHDLGRYRIFCPSKRRRPIEFVTRLLSFRDVASGKTMGNAMAWGIRRSTTQAERCSTAIGSWWLARNSRPNESWYWQYWFEKDHSPDLAFAIARLVGSFLRWSICVAQWWLQATQDQRRLVGRGHHAAVNHLRFGRLGGDPFVVYRRLQGSAGYVSLVRKEYADQEKDDALSCDEPRVLGEVRCHSR
jgi:hypothetical protein